MCLFCTESTKPHLKTLMLMWHPVGSGLCRICDWCASFSESDPGDPSSGGDGTALHRPDLSVGSLQLSLPAPSWRVDLFSQLWMMHSAQGRKSILMSPYGFRWMWVAAGSQSIRAALILAEGFSGSCDRCRSWTIDSFFPFSYLFLCLSENIMIKWGV